MYTDEHGIKHDDYCIAAIKRDGRTYPTTDVAEDGYCWVCVGIRGARLDEKMKAITAERVALSKNATDTQEAAAFRAYPKSGSTRLRVYEFIRDRGMSGATDDWIEHKLSLSHQSASARRRELVLGGYVQDSGMRRATRRGTTAIVWIATMNDQHEPERTSNTDDPHPPTTETDEPVANTNPDNNHPDPRFADGICTNCGTDYEHPSLGCPDYATRTGKPLDWTGGDEK